MTVDRRPLVARSVAALDDQGSIEIRSLADIKAELAALGIDPSASIEAARVRARERTSPAERLLARLDEADAASSDIDALENADIEDIKTTVPDGMAASVAAGAKQRAGVPTNVTRLKRQSGRFWGWGGSMVGLAACLLLFVITRPDQFYQVEPLMIEEADDVDALSSAEISAEAELDQALEVHESRRLAEEPAIAADLASPPAQTGQGEQATAQIQKQEKLSIEHQRAAVRVQRPQVEEAETETAEIKTNETVSERVQSLSEDNAESSGDVPVAAAALAPTVEPSHQPMMKPLQPSHQPIMKPLTTPRDVDPKSLATREKQVETIQTVLAKQNPSSADFAEVMLNWDSPKALHIVDPNAAPLDLQALARHLPKSNLIDRLDDARLLLGQRPLLALMTVLRDGKDVDVVVTSAEDASLVGQLSSFTDLAPSMDQGVEIIDLPQSP